MHFVKTLTIANSLFFSSIILVKTSGDNNNDDNNNNDPTTYKYGVDISFPIHHETVSTNYPWHNNNNRNNDPIQPLGNRQEFYNDFIDGCRESATKFENVPSDVCETAERERLDMNLGQASAMKNYTANGFKKIPTPLPTTILTTLRSFWDDNRDRQLEMEEWHPGETYVNHWIAPTHLLDVKNPSSNGGGIDLTDAIVDKVEELLLADDDDWLLDDDDVTDVTFVSLYGVRVYDDGTVVAPHLDRLPLVLSAMICVGKDLEEEWPVELIGHDGVAYNVSLDVGDVLLYEGHSVINGHPFALKGNYFAALYVHFHPANEVYDGIDDDEDEETERNDDEAEDEEEEEFLYDDVRDEEDESTDADDDGTEAHRAATDGDLSLLQRIVTTDGKSAIVAADANGWQPLHEAARAGHVDVVAWLVADDNGVDVNAKTADGATPLYYAVEAHGNDHPVVDLLVGRGGVLLPPVPDL